MEMSASLKPGKYHTQRMRADATGGQKDDRVCRSSAEVFEEALSATTKKFFDQAKVNPGRLSVIMKKPSVRAENVSSRCVASEGEQLRGDGKSRRERLWCG